MSIAGTIISVIKRHFISGVLVVVPIILTYLVIHFLFTAVDDILRPLLHTMLGYYIPGLGIVTTLLLIMLAGFFTRHYVGDRIYQIGDRVLNRMPIIRPIYSAAKQLLEAATGPSVKTFKEVVLIEYPRKGIYAMGFASNLIQVKFGETPQTLATVFIPSTPAPVSGFVVLVPQDECQPIDMTAEEGLKFLVSGGVASPDLITARSSHIKDKSMQNDEV